MVERRFAAAVTPYINDMVYVALALVGPTEAEDAAQEALLRAWRAAATLREGDTVRAWLLRITANACHDWRRGRAGAWARLTTTLPDDTGETEALAAPDADPGSSAAVTRLDLRQQVNVLADDLRAVVVLRFYTGLNATEIGAALDIPASTVRTRLQRALAQLRAHADSDETEPQTEARS
jgi:RNA polymerase sigma-70 factor (ECF subfamily)